MALVFAYGTLNDPEKQEELFGARLVGKEDVLLGYAKVDLVQDGQTHQAAVKLDGKPISGQVLELSEKDLKAADEWEGDAYERKKLKLQSGTEAWVYVKK